MRFARPWRLKGKWGAWVTGESVKPDMLMCVRTRNGKSWFSKVDNVLEQRASGAICERTDIPVENGLNLEIPFLSHVELGNSYPEWIRNWVYYRVEDANGPAPVIDEYEYYEVFESDRDFYEFCAQNVIEELRQTLLSLNPWTTQSGPSGNSNGEESTFRENKVARESQGSVLTSVPPVEDRSETHCMKCGRECSRCVCRRGIPSDMIVIDKNGSVYLTRNTDRHH